MKKITRIIFAFVMSFFLISVANAGEISFKTTTASNLNESLGAVEAAIIPERFKLSYAQENDGIILPNNNYGIMTGKAYEALDMAGANPTFDAERDNYITCGSSVQHTGPFIVYKNSLAANPAGINGHELPVPIKLKFKEAVIFNDGTYGDLYLEYEAVYVYLEDNPTTKAIPIIGPSVGFVSYYSAQERDAAYYLDKFENGSWSGKTGDGIVSYSTIGSHYDIKMYVTKAGTNEKVNKKLGIVFKDLDQASLGGERETAQGAPKTYTESIGLKSGVINDEVNVLDGNYMKKYYESGTGVTILYGSQSTSSNNEDLTGFAAMVRTDGVEFGWSGHHAATGWALIPLSKVLTSRSGEYKTKVTITKTDDKVLWKNNKSIVMTPSKNFYVTKVTIDGVEIDYQSLTLTNGKRTYTKDSKTYNFTEENGVVTYIFSKVVKDHEIDVQVSRNWKITTKVTNGTIDPTVTVADGTDKTIKFSPNEGNILVSVTVDGEVLEGTDLTQYEFTEIKANHVIEVLYAPKDAKLYKITTKVTNGEISDSSTAIEGSDVKVSFKPNENYLLESVTVDGVKLEGKDLTEYEFKNITADHTIEVVYSKIPKTGSIAIGLFLALSFIGGGVYFALKKKDKIREI